MSEFSIEDLRKYHEEEGARERLACPYCHLNIDKLDDPYEMSIRGFVKSQLTDSDETYLVATHGICINNHSPIVNVSPFGVPLILESELDHSPKQYQLSEEEIEKDLVPPTPAGPSMSKKNAIKTKATNALGNHLYELDPPYTIEQFMSSHQDDREGYAIGKINSSAYWFDLLWPFLIDGFNTNSSGTIKEKVLITVYLHKTAELRHIEPIWMYYKRFGTNLRTLERVEATMPAELPHHFQRLFDKIEVDYEPDRSTIESLIHNFMHNKICQKMDSQVLNSFISSAKDFLNKMKHTTYDGNLSCYEFLISNQLVNPTFRVGGYVLPHAGIIETICIYATLQHKSPSTADDLFRVIFPSENAPIWKMVLSDHGANIGDPVKLNRLIKHIRQSHGQ